MSAPSMLRAALWYAAQGLPVFPLRPRAKEPLTEHGFQDATTEQARIAAWWRQWPDANIGLPTGGASGLLVLDIDPRNGGDASLAEMTAAHGPLPETAVQHTGGGGQHFVFRLCEQPIRCGMLARGIDIKADGGYIVVAPSVHPSGNAYRWNGTGGAKALLNPVAAPAWLLERLTVPAPRPAAGGDGWEKWGEGERNAGLTSLAGSMRRRGMSQSAIAAALLEENRKRCEPPLRDGEVRRIAGSVARYAPAPEATAPPRATTAPQALTAREWPEPLADEAFHGVAGELVRLIEPHTEADPAALLVQFLVAFGNLAGRGAHFRAEADEHHTNLFTVIVGQTSKGRKGTSLGQIQRVLSPVDPHWSDKRIQSGLASGEGLIWAVRDELVEQVPVREKGKPTVYEEAVTDPGETDKRLLVVEPEFARVLQVAEREANTLSAVVRQSWDSGTLRVLTKKQTARATGAHISIIGHITRDELRRLLTDTAIANGFANRFLWVCGRRSKCLPEGGSLEDVPLAPVVSRIRAAAEHARRTGELRRNAAARAIWHEVYATLSEGRPGLLGSVISRAEAQTMRLGCLYGLLDCAAEVGSEHLKAALAVWEYCEASARYVFGDALGDAVADEILRELRQRPQGMSRTEIREHFQRNRSSSEIGQALAVLQEYGLLRLVRSREEEGDKRPTERWFALTA
jgi:hypothetical protein